MAVRGFDGVDDVIGFDAGALATMDGGPITIAGIVKLNDLFSGGDLIYTNDPGFPVSTCWRFNSGSGVWNYSTDTGNRDVVTPPDDIWTLVAVTKATGSATPRGHLYNYNTSTWSHANAAGAMTDSTVTPGASGFIQVGGLFNFLNASIAVIGVWAAVLSDGDIEGLDLALSAWVAQNPNTLWAFNQASTSDPVLDLMGNGADQSSITGTTVITGDDPPGFDFSLGTAFVAPTLYVGPPPAMIRSSTW